MKKVIVNAALLSILLLSMIFVSTALTEAVTEDEINQAIDSGVAWLITQQKPDGSWGRSETNSLLKQSRCCYTM